MATRGFSSRSSAPGMADRIPPGQHLVDGFPVLSARPIPSVDLASWKFTLKIGPRLIKSWTWAEFGRLPRSKLVCDIHCVTSWSKLDTRWEGVLVEDILADARMAAPTAFMLALSHDGYSTNLLTSDFVDGAAMVATSYDGQPLTRDHGGPARLLVPRLYFWKSAKWVTGLQFTEKDEAGFWELRGYHMRGDPWREQRYTDD